MQHDHRVEEEEVSSVVEEEDERKKLNCPHAEPYVLLKLVPIVIFLGLGTYSYNPGEKLTMYFYYTY